jgi:antitoxin component YwqK of YwqJK toxin-antitoxin module
VEKKSPEGLLIERYAVINVKGQEVKHGKYERFDEQGKLAEQSTYDHGKLNGIRNLYQSGILESEETRVNDQFNGPYKAYHPNGKLKMEANYIKDVITGNVKVYYPSGTLKEIVRFADNVEDGPFTEYFENGKIKAEGTYKQSDGAVEDGELKLYDTTGMMIRIMNCELGKCTTKWVKDSIQL